MVRGQTRRGGAYVALNEAKPSTTLAVLQRLTAEALRRALSRNMNAPGMAGWSHRRSRDRLLHWSWVKVTGLKADLHRGVAVATAPTLIDADAKYALR